MSERPIHLLLVTYDDAPPHGGQGTYVVGLRAALEDLGVLVTTLSGRGEHAIRYPKRTGRAPLDFSIYINAHRELLDRTGYDVIHLLGGPGGVLLERRCRLPVVYTATHTYKQAHSLRNPKRVLEPLERRAYLLADRVAPISSTTADVVRSYGVDESRIRVIAPGVDHPRRTARHKGDGLPLVLFVGRLEPEKGVMDALSVMMELTRTDNARCVIVGAGSLDEKVRSAIGEAQSQVDFRGRVHDAELSQLYGDADILLVPSRYEGLGLVAVEAMVHNTLVIGYDVDGLSDLKGSGCVLVDAGDVDLLRAATLGALSDLGALQRAQEQSRMWAKEHYSWNRAAKQFRTLYTEVIGERATHQ